MTDQSTASDHVYRIEIDTGWQGDALDQWIPSGHVVGMRRFTNGAIQFAITPGPVITLTAKQARTIGESLLAAAILSECGAPSRHDPSCRTVEVDNTVDGTGP